MGRRRPPRCPSLSSRHIERALCAVRRRALADYYARVQFVDCHVPLLLDPVTNNMKGGMYGDVSVGIISVFGGGTRLGGALVQGTGQDVPAPSLFLCWRPLDMQALYSALRAMNRLLTRFRCRGCTQARWVTTLSSHNAGIQSLGVCWPARSLAAPPRAPQWICGLASAAVARAR